MQSLYNVIVSKWDAITNSFVAFNVEMAFYYIKIHFIKHENNDAVFLSQN